MGEASSKVRASLAAGRRAVQDHRTDPRVQAGRGDRAADVADTPRDQDLHVPSSDHDRRRGPHRKNLDPELTYWRLAVIATEDFRRSLPHLHLPDLARHRHRELIHD